MDNTELEKWTTDDVAGYLGIKTDSVRKWASRAKVHRVDGEYIRSEIEAARMLQRGNGWRSGQIGSHRERTGVDNGR